MTAPITREDALEALRRRREARRAGQGPTAEEPPGALAPSQTYTPEQFKSVLRRRRLERITDREAVSEGLLPPIAPPIDARPAVPETAAPTPEPRRVESLEAEPTDFRAREQFDTQRRMMGLPPQDYEAEQRRTDIQKRAVSETAADVRDKVFAAGRPRDTPLMRRMMTEVQRRLRGEPPPPEPDTPQRAIGPDPRLEFEARITAGATRTIEGAQEYLARQNLPHRMAFALGAGAIKFGEAILNPLDPTDRTLTQKLENIQTGGGLTAPLDERRNVLANLGIGIAEYMPTLVALQAAGVLGAAGRMTAQVRGTIVGALESKFGKRAATRIFEEALKESAEEGLSVALFESVIGRGAGRDLQGRLTVFGEEVLAETGGFVFGAGIGTSRAVFGELTKLKGPISREIIDSGIQSVDQIPAVIESIANRRGTSTQQVMDLLSAETDESTIAAIIRVSRSSRGATMRQVRRERQMLGEQIVQEEAERPIREYAAQLAATGTVRHMGALRAVKQRFPRLNDEDAARFVSEAYGVAPRQAGGVDIQGVDAPEGLPVGEEQPLAPKGARERDPQLRAQLSSRLATQEVTVDRRIKSLTDESVEVPPTLATLEDLQIRVDELITEAASAGENAIVDRAARLSARIRDAIENPPVRPEKAPEPEVPPTAAPEPKGTPERPEATEEPTAKEPEEKEEPMPVLQGGDRLPPARRLDPEQRRQAEEVFGEEATRLSDEELQEELAGLGIEPRMIDEPLRGRRITDLTDEELEARVRAAGGEIPGPGPEYRERLLEVVDPGRRERLESLQEERRELRGRLAGEIRGRRAAEQAASTDKLTGIGSQRAWIAARPSADVDPNTSIVEFDIRNLKAANEIVSEARGDELIIEAANAVSAAAREFGISPRRVFRSGGDELVVLAPKDVAEQVRDRAIEIMGDVELNEEFAGGLRGVVGATAEEAAALMKEAKAAETGRYRPTGAQPAPIEPRRERKRAGPTYDELRDDPDADLAPVFEAGTREEVLVERPSGKTERLPVEYGLVELDEIRASHRVQGGKATRNPDFPEEVQPRTDVDVEGITGAASDANFDEGLLIIKSPAGDRGPVIIQNQGVVLSGNHRAEILRLVYERGGKAAERYRAKLEADAEKFGLTRDQVGDFDQPVLVRKLVEQPDDVNVARQLADDFNRAPMRDRTAVEEATLASQRMSDDALALFDTHFGDDDTVRAFLNTPLGKAFLERLISDGTIPKERFNQFLKDGQLTSAGRDFIENLLLGRALGSAEAIEQLPAAKRNALIKAAPYIAGVRGGYAIQPALQEAAEILGEQGRAGQTIRDFLGQKGMFGDPETRWSGPGRQLAFFLSEAPTQKAVVESFRHYRSQVPRDLVQGELIPGSQRSPREAFALSFGTEMLGEPRAGLEFAAEGPAPKPVTKGQEPRLKLTPERQEALRKLGIEVTPEQQRANIEAFRRRSELRAARKERRQRGTTEGTPVQRGGAEPRGAGEAPPEGIPGPGVSGGGRAGDESRNIDPAGEPGVARGQREREKKKLTAKDKKAERARALDEERKRFDEARVDADDVTNIKSVPEDVRASLRAAADAAQIDPKLVDDQLKDVARVQSNLLDAKPVVGRAQPGFLVGNSPGTGKTFVGGATIRVVMDRAKAQGREGRVLIVIPGKAEGAIVKQWRQALTDVFDLEVQSFKPGETDAAAPGVYTVSATGLGNQFDAKASRLLTDFGRFDLVVFDESHLFTNLLSAKRAFAARAVRVDHADRVLHLSATPFEFPWDMAYLDNLGLWGRGTRYADFEQWLAAHGIRKAKGTKHTYYFVHNTREDVLRTLTQIRREMVEAGIYTQREIRLDKKLRNDFVEVPMDNTYGLYYHDVKNTINFLLETATGVNANLLRSALVTFTRRITELAKIPTAIRLAKQFAAEGRSVVLFTGYKINFKMADRMAERFPVLARVVEGIDEKVREGVERIVRELGGEDVVGQVHGARADGQRELDIADFMSGKKKFLVATVDAGGTGLSLHDLTGEHPRVQINLSTPWTGKGAEQLSGRTYRVGSKTDVQMIWMGVDTPIERGILQRVAAKMQALGALVQGKTETDAVKLAEFDFLPESELQAQMFGFKQDTKQAPEASLDFEGKPNELRPTESEAFAKLEDARLRFQAGFAEASGAGVFGKVATPQQQQANLELPRPNQKILKPTQIIGKAARQFIVRTFLGGIKKRTTLGRFYIVADLVRIRSAQDVRTAAHEFGHHIDKHWFGFLAHPKHISAAVPTHLLPFVNELKPLAYAGAKDPVSEGFAEFVGEYVTNIARVQREAPKFLNYFRDHLNRHAPRDLATLDWMRQQVDLLKKYPPAERIGSRVIVGDSGDLDDLRIEPGKRFRKWFIHWLDRQDVFRDMDAHMMKEDPTWRPLQLLARRIYGAEPLGENMMNRGVMDFKELDQNSRVVRRSKGLPEIFKPVDKREVFDLFRYWAVALRASELHRRGKLTGLEDLIQDGTVDELLRQVQNSEHAETFGKVWADLREYQDALLQWLIDSENLTKDQVFAMKTMNELYVPFQRLLGEPDQLMDWVRSAQRSGGRGAEGVVGLPPAVHRFKGDTRPIIDPVESIVGNTRYFTQLGFRKPVENQLANFSHRVFGAEGHGQFIQEIDPKLVVSRFPVKMIRDALQTLGIKMEDVTDEQLAELVTIFHPMRERKKMPVFSAIIGGKRKWYQVNDEETWNALVGTNPVVRGWLFNLAVTSKNVLRGGVVMSPEFMLRNFVRDAQTAWIQTPYRGAGAMRQARRIPMVAALEGMVESVKAGKLWDEYVASGAAGSALSEISRRTNQDYMRKMFGRKGIRRTLSAQHSVVWNMREAYRMVRDFSLARMHDMNHASSLFENANRLSTFRAGREEGANFLEAGFAARNVSTDFAVHGSGLEAWRLTTAFLNPAMQGIAREVRQFKNRPLLTLARSSMLTWSSMALWFYNQNDPDYPEYSNNIKTRYWVWRDRTSGIIWRVPKAYGYGDVFGYGGELVGAVLAEHFLDWAYHKDPDVLGRVESVLKQGFGFTMLPTAVLPLFEVAINQSLYFGTPIETQGQREGLPKQFRANVYTSESSRKLSEAIWRFAEKGDAAGLPDRVVKMIQLLNFSPVQYDHLVRGYFGTLGNDLWQEGPNLFRGGTNLVRRLRDMEPLPYPPSARFRNHFIVRGFTIQFPTGSAESIRRFYDRRELLNEIAANYERLMETDLDEALEYHERHSEAIMLAPLYDAVAGKLAAKNRQKHAATSPEEIDQINREALTLAQEALKSLGGLTDSEQRMLQQRSRERLFLREESRELQAARDRIDLLVMYRQLQGQERPTAEEAREVVRIINSVEGLTGSQRGNLRRYYRDIRRGTLVDREARKTTPAQRRRYRRAQREERN